MGQYMILIYENEAAWADAAPGTFEQVMKGHEEFNKNNAAVIRHGEALQPTGSATSIRPDSNRGFVVTDGPFVETKETLGGFYLVEAADLDAAIALAKQVPSPSGGVEVRPVRVFD